MNICLSLLILTSFSVRIESADFDRFYDIDPRFESEINKVEVSRNIVNRHDFHYLFNPGAEFCSHNQNKIFLLVYVHSAPKNFKRRMAIRETWTKQSMFRDVKTVFIMGVDNNPKVIESLKLEYSIYNDIVQETFEDSYRNLTYKGIAALKWISSYCSNAKFVLKVDDDIITDIFVLLRHLNRLSEHDAIKPRTILCLTWSRMKVMREKENKWYVSHDEYSKEWFGKYCSGSAFVFTNDLPSEMYRMSFHVRFFWVDDYYITGLLARAIGANYERINSLYTISPFIIEQRFLQQSVQPPVFGHSPFSINIMNKIWETILFRHVTNYPHLSGPHATLISKDDFKYIKNFHWGSDIWKEFLEEKTVNTNNLYEKKFDIESF